MKVAITLLKLTEQGKILLVILGNEVAAIPKNVSLEHEYWKELVTQQHKTKGYKVEKSTAVCEDVVMDLVEKKEISEL